MSSGGEGLRLEDLGLMKENARWMRMRRASRMALSDSCDSFSGLYFLLRIFWYLDSSVGISCCRDMDVVVVVLGFCCWLLMVVWWWWWCLEVEYVSVDGVGFKAA